MHLDYDSDAGALYITFREETQGRVVSHELETLTAVSDRVVLLDRGVISHEVLRAEHPDQDSFRHSAAGLWGPRAQVAETAPRP